MHVHPAHTHIQTCLQFCMSLDCRGRSEYWEGTNANTELACKLQWYHCRHYKQVFDHCSFPSVLMKANNTKTDFCFFVSEWRAITDITTSVDHDLWLYFVTSIAQSTHYRQPQLLCENPCRDGVMLIDGSCRVTRWCYTHSANQFVCQ